MAEFNLAASVPGSWYCAHRPAVTLSWLTETDEYKKAIIVIRNTCAFPTLQIKMSAVKKACCEVNVLKAHH